MTSQYPTQPGWAPQTTPPPPPPPAKRHNARKILLILGSIVVGLFILGSLFGSDPTTTTPAPAARPAADTPAATDPPETSPPAPTDDTPKASDFKLTVKILEKTNFGSAGSNVTYRVEAGWPDNYDPDTTYEVTYEVRGLEGGAQVNTMEIEGDEYRTENEEFGQTPSISTKLTAKATSVTEA